MIGGSLVHNTHPAEIGSDLIAYLDDLNRIAELFRQP